MTTKALQDILRKPVVLGAIVGVLLIIVIWVFAFWAPEGRKLTSVQQEQLALTAQVNADELKVKQLTSVQQHYGDIKTDYTRLITLVPATEELYTYITTLSKAINASGVTVSSVSPGSYTAVSGEPYNAVPVAINIAGTYDALLKMIKAIYALPRLTDITALTVTGGGGTSNRSTKLTSTMQLEIFFQAATTKTKTAKTSSSTTSTTTTTAAG